SPPAARRRRAAPARARSPRPGCRRRRPGSRPSAGPSCGGRCACWPRMVQCGVPGAKPHYANRSHERVVRRRRWRAVRPYARARRAVRQAPVEPAPAPLSDWLAHALRLVAVERRERVLVLGELPVPALLHLARACGESGRVVAPFATDVACPRHPALVCVPIGSNASVATGAFDVVFAAPAVPPDMPPATLLAAARSALRPGGRLLVDLPARLWSDDFVRLQPLLESYGVHLPEGSDP